MRATAMETPGTSDFEFAANGTYLLTNPATDSRVGIVIGRYSAHIRVFKAKLRVKHPGPKLPAILGRPNWFISQGQLSEIGKRLRALSMI
jgi:hypothetical protein